MYPTNSIIALVLTVLLLASCASKQLHSGDIYVNNFMTIHGVKNCKEGHSGDAVDSQIGRIECDDVTLSYDYGRYGQKGPETALESFDQGFKNYHYSKFFELTHIDSKLYKIYIDSAVIESILTPEQTSGEPKLYECSTCNAVAKIHFLGTTFYYPTTINSSLLSLDKDILLVDHSADRRLKIYSVGEHLAATVYPLPYKRKSDYLAISIVESALSKEEEKAILHNIKLSREKSKAP